jgi:hypothetical protein
MVIFCRSSLNLFPQIDTSSDAVAKADFQLNSSLTFLALAGTYNTYKPDLCSSGWYIKTDTAERARRSKELSRPSGKGRVFANVR